MTDIKIDGLILAGGLGSRMNYSTKALLTLKNKTFIEHLQENLESCENIYISMNTDQKFQLNETLIRVNDNFKEIGPIGGLQACLSQCKNNFVFVVPCDSPNISKEFFDYVSSFISSDYDAYIIKDHNNNIHPLIGIYSKTLLPIINENIDNHNYKIMNILKKSRTKYIELKYTIFKDEIVKNINTFEDYDSLQKDYNLNLPKFISICGRKNSGKTTFICEFLEYCKKFNYKIGTIKHDGHDFQMDNLNSDTDQHSKAGSTATLIFSDKKFMYLEKINEAPIEYYLNFFKNFDFIILEGFKNKNYPKIEIVRKEISEEPLSNGKNLLFYITDSEILLNQTSIKTYHLANKQIIFNKILEFLQGGN
ncbi:molybdopterin-guanine dinucleotide biosynthesis protein B [Cetobacterium sp. SF1]|uniref:molybdopterin-guanine dinucleotide biosynthesis protein B n=1 Tax=unclassified Cetobacterium TaxID=2630983 RepID=UPI003CE9CA79